MTWIQQNQAGQRNWRAFASSSDGVRYIAAVQSGYLYTSTDEGYVWDNAQQVLATGCLWHHHQMGSIM